MTHLKVSVMQAGWVPPATDWGSGAACSEVAGRTGYEVPCTHLQEKGLPSVTNHRSYTTIGNTISQLGKSESRHCCGIQIPTKHPPLCSHRLGTQQNPNDDSSVQESTVTWMGTLPCRRERGSPWGEAEGGGAGGEERRRSSAFWLFLDLRSVFAALIFLGRPRFRPAIFLPFLFSFFFRALEGDGFLTVATPGFSSSAPES